MRKSIVSLFALATVTACSTFTRQEVASITADAAACILANIDLPNEQIALKCGISTADRIILDVIAAEARAQTAKALAKQAEIAQHAASCADAGAR